MNIRENILNARQNVRDNIIKGFLSDEEIDFIEKASRRAVGEAHPNGKWVWTDLGNGKYNWRVPKGKGAAAGSSDDSNKKKEENVDGKGENDRPFKDDPEVYSLSSKEYEEKYELRVPGTNIYRKYSVGKPIKYSKDEINEMKKQRSVPYNLDKVEGLYEIRSGWGLDKHTVFNKMVDIFGKKNVEMKRQKKEYSSGVKFGGIESDLIVVKNIGSLKVEDGAHHATVNWIDHNNNEYILEDAAPAKNTKNWFIMPIKRSIVAYNAAISS